MARYKNKAFQKYLIVDVSLAAVMLIIVPTFILTAISWGLVFACMLACMSPDLIWGWRMFSAMFKNNIKSKNRFSSWHTKIQWSETQSGIVVELAWFFTVFSLVAMRR